MGFRNAIRFNNKHFDRHEGRRDHSDRWDSDRHDRKHWKHDEERGRKFWHRDDKKDQQDESASQDNVPENADVVTWSLEAKGVRVEITAHADENGNVIFNYDLTEGRADLTGFFLDLDNDGGATKSLGRGNGMRGRDSDGDKMDGFDFAETLGSSGRCAPKTTEGEVVMSMEQLGISDLSELATAELGIRATGLGRCGNDKLKMANTGTFVQGQGEDATDPVEPDEPAEPISLVLDFPDMGGPIKVLTLAFLQPGGIEGGDFDQNSLRVIDVKLEGAHPSDLDLFIERLIEEMVAVDPYLEETADLKAVGLGGEGIPTDYFLYGRFNTNGETADDLPPGVRVDPVDGLVRPLSLIEETYTVTMNEDAFLFA